MDGTFLDSLSKALNNAHILVLSEATMDQGRISLTKAKDNVYIQTMTWEITFYALSKPKVCRDLCHLLSWIYLLGFGSFPVPLCGIKLCAPSQSSQPLLESHCEQLWQGLYLKRFAALLKCIHSLPPLPLGADPLIKWKESGF